MELLEKFGAQVPSLVVLVLVVQMFLKSQEQAREANSAERKEMFDRLNMQHSDHLQARAESRLVLADAAKAMQAVAIAVSQHQR